MKTLLSGAIVCATGLVLLLGGGSTFALWNDTETVVPAKTITAGDLSVIPNADGVWRESDGTLIDPITYRIVPGSTIEFTRTLTVSVVGDGLQAVLGHSSLTGTGILAPLVTTNLSATSPSAVVDGSTLRFNAGTATVDVKLTVHFPASATAGQRGTLDLGQVTFTLTQLV
ncbi:alternate-type signal peptide domain-containing protein [Lysobacter korlensis]|uniref:Alternate-type signal peptide domain-containing protein n=1 Tax=Lysobacter korlensis TaxID=553636 RepID=A0ABV6RW58_9GAMM